MTFEDALKEVKQGKSIRLSHWEEDVFVKVQYPHERPFKSSNESDNITFPYLYVEMKSSKVIWMPSIVELFYTDWEIK
jgi:hypothetical protein